MTPKEKSKQLIDSYRTVLMDGDTGCGNEVLCTSMAVKNAGICVAEVISQWEYIDTYLSDMKGGLNPNLKYWYGVKEELLKQ